jgi:glutamate dehydrogenase/leucine dehydrogenase
MRRAVGIARGQTHPGEQGFDPRAVAPLGSRQTKTDVVEDAEVRKQRAFLSDIADPSLLGRQVNLAPAHDLPAKLDGPRVCVLEAANEPHQGRLAAPRGAQQRHEGAGLDVEVDAPENRPAVEGFAEP